LNNKSRRTKLIQGTRKIARNLTSQVWLGRLVLSIYFSLLVVTSFHSHNADLTTSICNCSTACKPAEKDHAKKDQHPCPICKLAISLSQSSISSFRFKPFPGALHNFSCSSQNFTLSTETHFCFLRGPPAAC